MGSPLRIAFVLAAALCAGAALAKEPRASTTRVSKSGRYAIRLFELDEGKCRVEVLADSAPHWQLEACVGTVDDLYFVSDDGERFWVLHTIPRKGTRRPKKGRYPAWTYGKVAALYDREGRALKVKVLNHFVKSRMGLDDVRQLRKHFKWLEGVAGVPGNPPRLNAAGQVEFETVEPKTYRLDF